MSETLWVDSSETKVLAALSVVAGLVPATSIILALCFNVRGRRDKPGDDGGVIQRDRNLL